MGDLPDFDPLGQKPVGIYIHEGHFASCFSHLSGVTLCDPMDCGPPGSLPMEFPRQVYWSGLPFPTPGDLPES